MLILLLACIGNPTVEYSTEGCVDYVFGNPNPSTLVSSVKKGVADVYRSYVERPNLDDVFEPEIETDAGGSILIIREAWTPGGDGNATCLDPHIEIADFGAPIEVRWYSPDDENIPFDTVTVSPE
jgi:hypothetical protein